METPPHSSEQLREDRRDLAPSWHSPLFELPGYAVLITLAVYPWLDARGTARSSTARPPTRCGYSFHGPAWDLA